MRFFLLASCLLVATLAQTPVSYTFTLDNTSAYDPDNVYTGDTTTTSITWGATATDVPEAVIYEFNFGDQIDAQYVDSDDGLDITVISTPLNAFRVTLRKDNMNFDGDDNISVTTWNTDTSILDDDLVICSADFTATYYMKIEWIDDGTDYSGQTDSVQWYADVEKTQGGWGCGLEEEVRKWITIVIVICCICCCCCVTACIVLSGACAAGGVMACCMCCKKDGNEKGTEMANN